LNDAFRRSAPGRPAKDQSPPTTFMTSNMQPSNMQPTNLHSVKLASKLRTATIETRLIVAAMFFVATGVQST